MPELEISNNNKMKNTGEIIFLDGIQGCFHIGTVDFDKYYQK